MATNSGTNPILSRLKEFPHVRPELKGPTGGTKPHMAPIRRGGQMRPMKMPHVAHMPTAGVPRKGNAMHLLVQGEKTGADTDILHQQNATLDAAIDHYMGILDQMEGGTDHAAIPAN